MSVLLYCYFSKDLFETWKVRTSLKSEDIFRLGKNFFVKEEQ